MRLGVFQRSAIIGARLDIPGHMLLLMAAALAQYGIETQAQKGRYHCQ
jgi:hypothetical protein